MICCRLKSIIELPHRAENEFLIQTVYIKLVNHSQPYGAIYFVSSTHFKFILSVKLSFFVLLQEFCLIQKVIKFRIPYFQKSKCVSSNSWQFEMVILWLFNNGKKLFVIIKLKKKLTFRKVELHSCVQETCCILVFETKNKFWS